MSKSIKLSIPEWELLKDRLRTEYPISVLLIRETMKRKLGFVVREHREWVIDRGISGFYDGYGNYIDSIYLDFYDEVRKTFFLLRYGEYITADQNSDK
jgi:hypothetical protein